MRKGMTQRDSRHRIAPRFLGALLACARVVHAAEDDPVPRDPLELRALTEPSAVLQALPSALELARAAGDQHHVALLQIARANACRIAADWTCQRDAGLAARQAAQIANEPILIVRGLIAESRGHIALQEFARGEQLLDEAQSLLGEHPLPDLLADVHLGYSSLYYSLGIPVGAADYAERGLRALGQREVPVIRGRLLRNKVRALAQLGQWDQAAQVLAQARPFGQTQGDPKLGGEIEIESARVAAARGDHAAMQRSGERILELAALLKNAQLRGQGYEVLGNAANAHGDVNGAAAQWRTALQEFHQLGQDRDELRVLGDLLRQPATVRPDTSALLARYLELQARVEDTERRRTAQDLDTRLKYAQQKLDLTRLQGEAELSSQREAALREHQRLTDYVTAFGALVALVLAASFVAQRRSNRRLEQAFARLGESESRYRVLAENSRDLVVRMRLDGTRLYISPSVREMLGYAPEELLEPRWELVHGDDRAKLVDVVRGLKARGDTARVSYRIRRSDGEYAWLEALAQRVAGPTGDADEIVYTARDISERVLAERALEQSERRLRAVTDNAPAMITYNDMDERYTFANAPSARMFGIAPSELIGRTLREACGEALYASLQPRIAAALRGERQHFEGDAEMGGRRYYYESNFVPDVDADGRCRGFFALTTDITRRKLAELELDRLARIDSLTGIANRRQFDEAFAATISRAQRHARPLALLYLDIDRFKSINDSLGHQIGDAVIRAFATRLQLCLRQEDLLARLGGDEFVVALEEVARPEDAGTVAHKIVEAMRLPLPLGDKTLSFTTSVGVAFTRAPRDAETLIKLADRALYAAKEAGRNGYKLLEQADGSVEGTTRDALHG